MIPCGPAMAVFKCTTCDCGLQPFLTRAQDMPLQPEVLSATAHPCCRDAEGSDFWPMVQMVFVDLLPGTCTCQQLD